VPLKGLETFLQQKKQKNLKALLYANKVVRKIFWQRMIRSFAFLTAVITSRSQNKMDF
jgi:hypothetical protein